MEFFILNSISGENGRQMTFIGVFSSREKAVQTLKENYDVCEYDVNRLLLYGRTDTWRRTNYELLEVKLDEIY